MKRIDRFLDTKLPANGLNRIFGGAKTKETTYNGQCDVHYDDNDNDNLDPGECVEFVECENNYI